MADQLLEFLARWRGLPAIIGVTLVILNFVCGLIPGVSWLTWHDWMLHLGLIIAILGSLATEVL